MSDFDKEAERERLREKYEREEEKRQVTERMSELLLKGATMTNAHCQDCGDPIFRYDGQEFCATCQKTVRRQTEAREGGDEGSAENGDDEGEEIEVATPEDTRVQFGGDSERVPEAAGNEDTGSPEPESAGSEPGDAPSATAPAPPGQTDAAARRDASTSPSRDDERTRDGEDLGADGDLAAARTSLTRSVTALARRAEDAEDLGRQRDLLSATREAAEALAAVHEAAR